MVKLKAFPEDVCSSKAEMGLLRNKIMNRLHTIRAKAETEKASKQNFSTFSTFELVWFVSDNRLKALSSIFILMIR